MHVEPFLVWGRAASGRAEGGAVLSALAPSKIAVGTRVAVHLGEFSLDDPREIQDQPEIVELEMERQGGYGRDEVGEADHREHP